MEIQRDPAQPLLIDVSHDSFQRLLDQAAETDRHYPWLRQRQYLIDRVIMDDWIVRLKLG